MKHYLLLVLLALGSSLSAQVGIGTVTPNSDAILDMESANKGVLPPRVALTAVNAFAPLSAHVAGMVVYNTATAGVDPNNVVPGLYYNNGMVWVRLGTENNITLADIDLRNIDNRNHVTSDAGIGGTSLGTGGDNIAMGSNALVGVLTGNKNVAIGTNAFSEANNGNLVESIAIGHNAGQDFSNSWATLLGYEAGKGASGQSLIALGYQAGLNGRQGVEAIAIGHLSMADQIRDVVSPFNIGIGVKSLQGYDPGVAASKGRNIAIGSEALKDSRGHYNKGIGELALANAGVNSVSNIGIGFKAGMNSNGLHNIFIGDYTGGQAAITGNHNLMIGNQTQVLNIAGDGQINILNRIIGDSAGNIGIGANVPTERLDVNGKARVRTLDPAVNADVIMATSANGTLKKTSVTNEQLTNALNNATTSESGSIVLSGVLGGTYNNIELKDNAVTQNKIADNAITQNKIDASSVGSGLQLVNGKLEVKDAVDPSIRDQSLSSTMGALSPGSRQFNIFDPTSEPNSAFEVTLFGQEPACGFFMVIRVLVTSYTHVSGLFPTIDIVNATHNFGHANTDNPNNTNGQFTHDDKKGFFEFTRATSTAPTSLTNVTTFNSKVKVNTILANDCVSGLNDTNTDFVLAMGDDGKLKFENVDPGNILIFNARVRKIF